MSSANLAHEPQAKRSDCRTAQQAAQQRAIVERLRELLVDPERGESRLVLPTLRSRENEESHLVPLLSRASKQIEAGMSDQFEIGHDGIEGLSFEHFEGFGRRRTHDDVETIALQHAPKGMPRPGVVIDDQDLATEGVGCLSCHWARTLQRSFPPPVRSRWRDLSMSKVGRRHVDPETKQQGSTCEGGSRSRCNICGNAQDAQEAG